MNLLGDVVGPVAVLVLTAVAFTVRRTYRLVRELVSHLQLLLEMHNWPGHPPAGHIYTYRMRRRARVEEEEEGGRASSL